VAAAAGYPTPATVAATALCMAGVVPPRSVPAGVGHRGAEGAAVENSLPALAAGAAAVGAVETDVTLSAEGTAWLFHDDTLDAMANATGPACAATDDALRRVAVHGGAAYGLAGVTAPLARLTPALTAGGDRVEWMLDIKTCRWPGGLPPGVALPPGVTVDDAPAGDGCVACVALIEAVAGSLAAAHVSTDRVVFTSTQASALGAVRHRWPTAAAVLSRDVKVAWWRRGALEAEFAPWTGGALEWRLVVARPDVVASINARGGRVYGWTVRGDGAWRGVACGGAGWGITSYPERVAAWRAGK